MTSGGGGAGAGNAGAGGGSGASVVFTGVGRRESELRAALARSVGLIEGLACGLRMASKSPGCEHYADAASTVGSEAWRLRKILEDES